MSTTTENKINHIFHLLEKLAKGEELYVQNLDLQEEFFGKTGEAQEVALRRYLKDIHKLYGHIVLTEKKHKEFSDRKVTVYYLPKKKKAVSEIFRYFIEHSSDLSWLLQLVHESDPSILDNMQDKKLLETNMKEDEDIFLFKSSPFENLENDVQKKLFAKAKIAVKYHEYRTILYRYLEEERLENVKCLKMIYMNNNWYLAVEDEYDDLRFLRLSFIQDIAYAKGKAGYQIKILEKYSLFFQTLQNPMTLNGSFEKVYLRASPKVAIYFKKGMKPFFPSQKFIRDNDDGTVEFSVDFTQPLEVLPFIKQWQPDLTILSPDSLRETFIQDMQQSLKHHT